MNNTPENPCGNYGTGALPEEPKRNVYTKTHAWFALIALVIGSLWYNLIFVPDYKVFGEYKPIAFTIFTIIFAAFAVAFFTLREAKITADARLILTATVIYSLRFSLYPTDYVSTANAIGCIVIHVTALLFFRCIGNPCAFDTIVGDTAKAVFVDPFASFLSLFASFSAFFKRRESTDEDKEKARKIGTEIGLVLLGLFFAVPILCIVFSLLISDSFFTDFIGNTAESIFEFFDKIDIDIWRYLNPITILVSLFIYGAMYSADKKRLSPPPERQSYSFLPETITRTISVVLLAVYVIFVIAQIDGFMHMFMGRLPEGKTYAEVARSGFFELCGVACINGAVLYYSELFALRSDGKKRSNIIQYLLCGFTMFLIATAATKMIMYICAYGFTPKRFYTTLFMILLAVLFVLAIRKLRNPNFRLSRYSVYVVLVWLALLLMIDYKGLSEVLNASVFSILQ